MDNKIKYENNYSITEAVEQVISELGKDIETLPKMNIEQINELTNEYLKDKTQ